jgi:hypothetical protein
VLCGRYQLRIGSEIVAAAAGECVLIAAGVPDAPVAHDQRATLIINAYVAANSFIPVDRHVRFSTCATPTSAVLRCSARPFG